MKTLKIMALFCAVCVMFTLSSCDVLNDPNTRSFLGLEALVPEDFDLYADMCGKIEAYETVYIYDGFDKDEIIDTYMKIIDEHPEYFWLLPAYSYKTKTRGDYIQIELTPGLLCSADEIEDMNAKFTELTDSLLSDIAALESEYEKILWVHDYIIDNTDYDKEAAASGISDGTSRAVNEACSAYGCLVNKCAVCSGYTAAFQLLLQKSGITCGAVTGARIGGESHAWNYVLADGEYYYVDVTWDDPLSDNERDNKTYEFFMITTAELERTHTIDAGQFVPQCTATKYDYFIYNGTYLERYDFDAVSALFDKHASDGRLSIKFSSTDEKQAAVADLIDNGRLFDIPAVKSKNASYSSNSSSTILTVWFE